MASRGYFDSESAKQIAEFKRRMERLFKQIPQERARFTKWLKETGFKDKITGEVIYDYNKLGKAQRKIAMVENGFTQVSQSVQDSMTRIFASIGQTHPEFSREGLQSFGDIIAEALAEGTDEGARAVYTKWQQRLMSSGKLKVGHHTEPLKALWAALENVPDHIRRGALNILSNEGFRFGENALDDIFQILHTQNDFNKLSTDWQSVLDVSKPWLAETASPALKAAILKRLGHATSLGGTALSFIKPKPDLLKGVTDSKEAANRLRYYARIAKNQADVTSAASRSLEPFIYTKKGAIRSKNSIIRSIKDGSFETALNAVPEVPLLDNQDLAKFRPRGQVITGGWKGQAPGAMMMQADGTAALDPAADWKRMLGNLDVPDNIKAQLRGFTEANDIKGALQFARTSRTMPWMAGLSIPLGEWANAERRKEIAANPNDNWLKFQYMLDDWSLKADYASVATYGAALTGKGVAVPAGLEVSSNLAALASLGMDLDRWRKIPGAVDETMDYWISVYTRGTRNLLKGAQRLF